MLQRPQTLLFFLAAILVFLATFAPISTYSLDASYYKNKGRFVERIEKTNPRLIVKPSKMMWKADYSKEVHRTEKRYEKGMKEGNEEIQKELDKRGISIIFVVGLAGMLLLTALVVVVALLYKKRKLQLRLGFVVIFFMVVVSAGMYVAAGFGMEALSRLDLIPERLTEMDWQIDYNYGFFMLPIAAIVMFIGLMLVRKDENLIRSIDRIR